MTRYQDWPGQATAYMVGRLRIIEARKLANDALGKEFNLKDFHYQVMFIYSGGLKEKFKIAQNKIN